MAISGVARSPSSRVATSAASKPSSRPRRLQPLPPWSAGEAAAYLSWRELDEFQRGRRWEIQLESGTGNFLMRYGPAPGDVGPFYAYRGTHEVLGGRRERVFGDFSVAERQLTHFVHGYRPLAVAPPYGNYGQAGTKDPEIPRLLLARLQLSFPLVFTQDRPALAARGAGTAQRIGRLELTPGHGDRELQALLSTGTP
jgi:hypothetical protein